MAPGIGFAKRKAGTGGLGAGVKFVDVLPTIEEAEADDEFDVYVLNSDASAWALGMIEFPRTPAQAGTPAMPEAVPGTLSTAEFTTTQFARWFGVHANDAAAGVSTSTDPNLRDFYFDTTIERLKSGDAGGWGISGAINISGWPAGYEWAGGFTNAAGAGSFDNLAALLAEFDAGDRVYDATRPLVYHDRAIGQVRYVTGFTAGLPAGRDVVSAPAAITTAPLGSPLAAGRTFIGAFTDEPPVENVQSSYYRYGGDAATNGFYLNDTVQTGNPWLTTPIVGGSVALALLLAETTSAQNRAFIGPGGAASTDGVNTVAEVIIAIENPGNYGLPNAQRYGTIINEGQPSAYTITFAFFDSADNTVKVVTGYSAQVITPGTPAIPGTQAIAAHLIPGLVRVAGASIRVANFPAAADAHQGLLYVATTGEGRIIYDAPTAAIPGTGSHSPIPDHAVGNAATFVNYSHAHYLGVMAADPSVFAHSVGNYYFNSTTRRWRRLVTSAGVGISRHWENWAAGPPGGFIGSYASETDATARVTALNNLYYNSTSNVIRRVQTFTPGNPALVDGRLGLFSGIRDSDSIPQIVGQAEFYLNSVSNTWRHYDGGTAITWNDVQPADDGNLIGPSIVWMTEPPNVNGDASANYADATAAVQWFEGRPYDPLLRYWYNDATDGISQITHITQYPFPAGTEQAWQSMGAFRLGPTPNDFATTALRDAEGVSDPDWLAEYDADDLLYVTVTAAGVITYYVRRGGAWQNVTLVVKGERGDDADATEAEAARAGAEAARTGAEAAQTAAEADRTGSETARADSEAASGVALAARDAASGYAVSALAARNESGAARDAAQGFQVQAAQAAAAAEAARDAALAHGDIGTALAAAVTGNTETGIDVTYDNGKLNFVVTGGGGTPPVVAHARYAALTIDQQAVAADFEDDDYGASSDTEDIILPTFTENRFLTFTRRADLPDPTFIGIRNGQNQIGGFIKLADSLNVVLGGVAEALWQHVDGNGEPEVVFPVLSGTIWTIR